MHQHQKDHADLFVEIPFYNDMVEMNQIIPNIKYHIQLHANT